LARGLGAVDLRVVLNIVISWVVTLPAGAILAMFFYFTLKGLFS
jgi:PiT family inorganic phosphate transporter